MVVRADRHAAGDEQHVAARRGLDGGARGLAVVGHDRVQHDLGAGGLGEQPQREPVGLVDPAGLGRRADLEQLAARREHVHDRAAVHGDLADARGGERRDALHGQRRAGGGEHVAARDVLAAVADVEAVRQRPGRRHARRPPPSRPRRAGSRRRRPGSAAPVVMPTAVPGRERARGDLARRDLAGEPQRGGRVGVGGPHRVAVHRGAVERRQVDGGRARPRPRSGPAPRSSGTRSAGSAAVAAATRSQASPISSSATRRSATWSAPAG